MRDASLQITRLLSQACAQYPGGKRAVFRAISAQTNEPKAESTFYAQFNGNESSEKPLTLENLLWAMKVTGDYSALLYMASLFGFSLMSLDALEPDAPSMEAEMLQDYPRLVDFHRGCEAHKKGEITKFQLDALKDAVIADIRQTFCKATD